MIRAIDEQIALDTIAKFEINTADIIFSPESIALRDISERRGKVYFPFFSFWRTEQVPAPPRARTPVAMKSQFYAYATSSKRRVLGVKAVPIDLGYELTYWAGDGAKGEGGMDGCREALEKFLFWKYESPNLYTVSDQGITFGFNLIFGEPRDDNMLADKYKIGKIYKYVFPITVQAWIFKGYSFATLRKIFIDFWGGVYPSKSDFLFEIEHDIVET